MGEWSLSNSFLLFSFSLTNFYLENLKFSRVLSTGIRAVDFFGELMATKKMEGRIDTMEEQIAAVHGEITIVHGEIAAVKGDL